MSFTAYNFIILSTHQSIRNVVFYHMAGYREAECGWVMVGEEDHHEEELPKSSLRTALFLVIYATKRGILEVGEGGWRHSI